MNTDDGNRNHTPETPSAKESPENLTSAGADGIVKLSSEVLLQESEDRFRILFDACFEGVILSEEGRITDCNHQIFRLLGYERTELTGQPFLELMPPESRDSLLEEIRDGEETVRNHEMIRKDGSRIPVEMRTKVIPIHERTVRITILRDISDALQADAALRRASEERDRHLAQMNALINQMTEGLVIFDPDGQLLEMNRAALDIHGFEDVKMLPGNLAELSEIFVLYDLDGRELTTEDWPIGRVLRGETFALYDVKVRRVDTGETWIGSYGGTPVHDREGRMVLAIVTLRDVTQRYRAQAALWESREQLKALNQSLEQRVAGRTAEVQQLADQLRALAAELGQVEQRERKRLAGILHDHIQQILVAARMQLEWARRNPRSDMTRSIMQGIDSMLKEAIEACRSLTVELSPPVLHEAGLTGGLHWLVRRMSEKNQFTVRLDAGHDAEPAAEEMRFFLFECVRELLFNILKHANVREASVAMQRQGDQVEIVVEDTGGGFDVKTLKERSVEDTTFGLFSIQHRLAHLGGSIRIESAPGHGTRVTLTAPAGEPAAPPERDRWEETDPAEESILSVHDMRDTIQVLIVDDHPILREGLAGLLQSEPDIEIVGEAEKGESAIALAGELRPDIVLMDVNLPGMNGVEATGIIRNRYPDVNVIGLSMHIDENVAADMRNAGAVAYLTKGGPSQDLIDTIRAFSARSETERK